MDDLDLAATLKGFAPGQKVFNRYTLKKILGRGGMGVVWLARDETLELEVALKFLPEIVALDPEAMADLKRETRRNLDLTHPNIVRIYDFVSDSRTAAIAMEYVDGPTLSALKVEKPGRVFTVPELRPWVAQLCAALSYAHTRAKVVHRDLKPANLMITAAGDLKVTDFGIARGISDSVSRVSAQMAGSSGTPVYMSPQQMMGERAAVTDDIYAIGATLYELLTGKPPFHSGNIVMQVQMKVPPSLAERRAELDIVGEPIPAAWEATIAACLAKEPQGRPSSIDELRDRLESVAPPPKAETTVLPEPRELVVQPDHREVKSEAVASPAASGTRGRRWLVPGLVTGAVAIAATGYFFVSRAMSDREEATVLSRVVPPGPDDVSQAAAPVIRRVVSIQTTPAGASVSVESLGGGLSPLTLLNVAPGTYRVKAEMPGYDSYEGEVLIQQPAPGTTEPQQVRLPLVRSVGQLRVDSQPSGLAYVLTGPDGAVRRGRTPAFEEQLPVGMWEFTVLREGFGDRRGSVLVKRGEDSNVQADMADGRLVLESDPAGAEVWSGGERLGVTPYELAQARPGRHDLELRLSGYARLQISPEVRPREQTRQTVTLQRLPHPVAGLNWENTLGMRFVPVPGMTALVAVWETREADYAAFVRATNRGIRPGRSADHPVVEVSWDDARAFCEWLTAHERREGRLTARQRYRLPTDAEWSLAVGLVNERGGSPKEKDGRIKDVYPWGAAWPPPAGAGNYSPILGVDDFEGLAPVGSFSANRHGLHDMGGNVWEWCEDWYDPSVRDARVLRGASFSRYARDYLLSSYRSFDPPGARDIYTGFRCVLDVDTQ